MDDEFNYKKEHSRSKHSIDRLLDGTKSWCPREPQRWRYAAKELSTSNLSAPTRIRNRISRTQEKGTKSRSLPALSTTEPAPGSILISNKRLLATTNKSIDLNVLVGEGRWTMSLTTKKSSKLTEKRRNWLVCNSVIWGKNIGGGFLPRWACYSVHFILFWPLVPGGGYYGCGFFNFMARTYENRKAILEFNVRSAGLRAQLNFYTDFYVGR
jgi:hypothetical protein